MLSNMQKIGSYANDIMDVLNNDLLSPFDLIGTLSIRDALENDYDNLNENERVNLYLHDKRLLTHVDKFYVEISKVIGFNNNMPLNHWWAHLDKIISGEMTVDLDNRKVCLREQDEQAAATA